ncbi:MAG: carboxypeptidase regulatory-like domain-containing protein [Armatimonadetes bacterium]|nr:carboxypeptidase regulatory-like domain-containing protein [Armatimonadota bacterium]
MQPQLRRTARRSTRPMRVVLFAGVLAGLLTVGNAGLAVAGGEKKEKPRAVKLYWKTGPLGRYTYPSLLWNFDDRDRDRRGQGPAVFREQNPDPLTPPPAAFDGQFLNAETGHPIPEVEAIISYGEAEPGVVLTDGRGRFSAEDVPAGQYSIASHAAGYYDEKTTVTLVPGKTNVVRLRLRPRPAAFAGHLRAGDGQPVAGARVVLKDSKRKVVQEMATLADGSFGAGGLKAGRYTLEVTIGEKTTRTSLELKPGDIQELELAAK